MFRVRRSIRWLGVVTAAAIATVYLTCAAFSFGGPNGMAAWSVDASWPLWSPVYRAVSVCGDIPSVVSQAVLCDWTRVAWSAPYDMLSQVRGARMAVRDYRDGNPGLIGARKSGRGLPGLDGIDDGQLAGPMEDVNCKVTWLDQVGFCLGQAAGRAQSSNVPRGLDEVTCILPDGGVRRLHLVLQRQSCFYEPTMTGYNQRMLRLLLDEDAYSTRTPNPRVNPSTAKAAAD